MKAVCDVHIAWRVVRFLQSQGIETIHVNQMPARWYTTDKDIIELDAIVITKDIDFRNSFLLKRTPRKLLHICVGNASNQELITYLTECLLVLRHLMTRHYVYLELNTTGLDVLVAEGVGGS